MKRIFSILILLSISTFLFAERIQIVDYKGSTMGANIPEWVRHVINEKPLKIKKAYGEKGKYKCFTNITSGKNLDILAEWSVNLSEYDVILNSFSTEAESILKKVRTSKSDKKIALDLLSECYKNQVITINGLSLEESYWVKIAKENEQFYEFYTLHTMPTDVYKVQFKNFIDEYKKSVINSEISPKSKEKILVKIISVIQ